MRVRWLACAAILCMLTLACSQDIQGLRTPRSPASQSLGIRWHQGTDMTYTWQLTADYSRYGDQPKQQTLGGECEVEVLSVDANGIALIQITIRLDPKYQQANELGLVSHNVDVGPRGRVTANPDGGFADILSFYPVLPFLPPAGANPGDRWHETYAIPNPAYGNTRDFSVSAQYVRNEGAGLMRSVVVEARMSASYNDAAPYERLYGTPPADAPQHMEDHLAGKQVVDVTSRYDPVRQSLLKSIATFQLNQEETLSDATNGKAVGAPFPVVGTVVLTFSRS